ncbi:MAG TPA: hypothetical protein VM735_01555, partial [Candidatus Kapabacteria bacterium]|nr:hypothetical protein [Candidatus Kapabacteria bacterium]
LTTCIDRVSRELRELPDSPFHEAIAMRITNPRAEVAAHFDAFFEKEASRFPIKASYTEINGFDINTDLWYFDVFAYSSYGGLEDFDWISDWQSDDFPHMPITGFERLQEVFASDAFGDDRFTDACDLAGLIFVLRFQELVAESSREMKQLSFPLLATAHDYDFIYQATTNA